MTKKPHNPKSPRKSKAKEPLADYGKHIVFFNSFEEEEEYTARQRAALSYDERMLQIEQLRKLAFSKFLLPDGTWPPVAKVFTKRKP